MLNVQVQGVTYESPQGLSLALFTLGYDRRQFSLVLAFNAVVLALLQCGKRYKGGAELHMQHLSRRPKVSN